MTSLRGGTFQAGLNRPKKEKILPRNLAGLLLAWIQSLLYWKFPWISFWVFKKCQTLVKIVLICIIDKPYEPDISKTAITWKWVSLWRLFTMVFDYFGKCYTPPLSLTPSLLELSFAYYEESYNRENKNNVYSLINFAEKNISSKWIENRA